MDELTIDDVLGIASLVLELDATTTRVAKLGPLDSALHAPFASYGSVDLYPEPWQKCAVLGARLILNHPFPDGNKRVSFLAMRAFARLNGFTWSPGNDAGPVIERVAGGDLAENEFVEWVHGSWA